MKPNGTIHNMIQNKVPNSQTSNEQKNKTTGSVLSSKYINITKPYSL